MSMGQYPLPQSGGHASASGSTTNLHNNSEWGNNNATIPFAYYTNQMSDAGYAQKWQNYQYQKTSFQCQSVTSTMERQDANHGNYPDCNIWNGSQYAEPHHASSHILPPPQPPPSTSRTVIDTATMPGLMQGSYKPGRYGFKEPSPSASEWTMVSTYDPGFMPRSMSYAAGNTMLMQTSYSNMAPSTTAPESIHPNGRSMESHPTVGPMGSHFTAGPMESRPTVGPMGSHPNNLVNLPHSKSPQLAIVGPMESRPTDGPMESRPTDGPMESRPTVGPMESRPTDGPMESRPTDGPMESRPTDGPMESRPTDGPMESRPTVGPMESRPTAGVESKTLLNKRKSSK